MTTDAAGVIVIGWPQLLLATGLVVFVGILSWRLTLGVEKELAIATVRTYVQLFLLGFVLTWVFSVDSWPLVIGIMLVMIAMASHTIIRRAPDAPPGILTSSFLSMVITGFSVTFIVTGLIIQVEPWYAPRYVIPIAGMVLGNSMTGIALALERTYSDMDARSGQLLALTALGATPWEAGAESVRVGIRAGLMPTIISMATVGIVFIPGMMTGQIIAVRTRVGLYVSDCRDADGRLGHGPGLGSLGAALVSQAVHQRRRVSGEGPAGRQDVVWAHVRSPDRRHGGRGNRTPSSSTPTETEAPPPV